MPLSSAGRHHISPEERRSLTGRNARYAREHVGRCRYFRPPVKAYALDLDGVAVLRIPICWVLAECSCSSPGSGELLSLLCVTVSDGRTCVGLKAIKYPSLETYYI